MMLQGAKYVVITPVRDESDHIEATIKSVSGQTIQPAQWVIVDDSAAPPPQGPVTSRLEDETVTLLPYGAARLRITSFPVLGPDEPPRGGE